MKPIALRPITQQRRITCPSWAPEESTISCLNKASDANVACADAGNEARSGTPSSGGHSGDGASTRVVIHESRYAEPIKKVGSRTAHGKAIPESASSPSAVGCQRRSRQLPAAEIIDHEKGIAGLAKRKDEVAAAPPERLYPRKSGQSVGSSRPARRVADLQIDASATPAPDL